ncbi:hypothetical protein vseg_020652 [Gypsophila vaccaria]
MMKMDAKNESHWWWFNNHNGSNYSPWLESTLTELNEKTKMMLNLVEADADSFSQRAEMYYKRRPELISLVEDFYRAHRSLAERYDQLKTDRSVRVKSPLKNLLCPSKAEYENGFDSTCSMKSYDSFTEAAYSSDESAESEVDDPEVDDDSEVDQGEGLKENPCSVWAGIDELTKLREELDRLQEENEIQRKHIDDSNQEKQELVNELAKLREELEAIKSENAPLNEVKTLKCDEELDPLQEENEIQRKQIDDSNQEKQELVNELAKLREELEAIKSENAPLNEVKTLKCDVASLKLYEMDGDEEVKLTEKDGVEATTEMTKLWNETQILIFESKKQREMIIQKDGEITEAVQKFEAVKQELMKIEAENRMLKDALKHEEVIGIKLAKLREETQTQKMYIEKLVLTEERLKRAEEEKADAKRLLEKATEELMNLREECQRKDQCLMETIEEKDDEKRAVIRQLSIAMEILREDNKALEKAVLNVSPKKKSPSQFQLSKLFNPSSKCHASVVHSWY